MIEVRLLAGKIVSAKDAKICIEEHEKLLAQLEDISKRENESVEAIVKASDDLMNGEINKILKNLSVDELNRNKNGFRIKTLKDSGYNTIYDILNSSSFSLSRINGISEEAAYAIYSVAESFRREAKKEVSIKISTDNKTDGCTKLVDAVSAYVNNYELFSESSQILKENKVKVKENLETLKSATKFFKRLFMPKEKKEEVSAAYNFLSEELNGDYQSKINKLAKRAEASRVQAADGWNFFDKNSVKFFNIVEAVNPGFLIKSDDVYGLPEETANELKKVNLRNEGLKCELRTYQQWGVKYILNNRRVLLGDEMGLGKTVQAIAAMVSLRNAGAKRFLVVCPASVLTNWCREINKMSDLNVIKIHGNDRLESIRKWISDGGVGVTTYETTVHFKEVQDEPIDMIVVDEAHYIKNEKAQRSINTRNLCKNSSNILLMTGTPLENRIEEMISLIRILRPEVASKLSGNSFFVDAQKFRNKIISVYYRRKRDDVLKELPELIEEEDWCTMTPADENAYVDSIYSGNYQAVRRVSWNVDDIKKSSKALRLLDIVSEAKEEGRKVIVFSFFLDTLRRVSELFAGDCYTTVTGALSPEQRQKVIDEFENGPEGSVLPLQINAGGTGLNIQSASVVVICEPQFKPSIENQAISRAYRMGQTRNVIVHRLLCEETIDEPMMERLAVKQKAFDDYADISEAAKRTNEFDEKSFGLLVEKEKERIQLKKNAV